MYRFIRPVKIVYTQSVRIYYLALVKLLAVVNAIKQEKKYEKHCWNIK